MQSDLKKKQLAILSLVDKTKIPTFEYSAVGSFARKLEDNW